MCSFTTPTHQIYIFSEVLSKTAQLQIHQIPTSSCFLAREWFLLKGSFRCSAADVMPLFSRETFFCILEV